MKSVSAGRSGRNAPLYSKGGPRIPSRIVELFDACSRSDRRASLFLVGLCLVALLPGFFSIPPVDRNEARFAEISRQMVETGHLGETRLGWEVKRTRPIGQHWLQAAVVAAAEKVGISSADRRIWLYRLPSLASAIAAVLLTFWAALAFTHRRAAMLAASLLAGSVAFSVGGRLAIPEMSLLAATAAMIGALGRLYLAERHGDALAYPAHAGGDGRLALIFWAGLAFGLFTKGLMTPIYVILPLAALTLVDRSARFLRRARSYTGLALILLVAVGWFLLRRYGAVDTQEAALARGLIGRVLPDYPGFTGPPGSYLLLFWAMFWPGAPLAALAVPIIWKARRIGAVRFLLAWILPAWLLFELWPVKLPAYVGPTLPAIAILIALAVERGAMALGNTRLARVLWLWPVIGAAIAVAALLGLAVFDRTTSVLAWPFLLLGFFALVTAASSVREYGVEKSALLAIAGMLVSGFGVMQLVLPNLDSFWLSQRMVAVAAQEPCAAGGGEIEVASAGYSEPSLVFLLPRPPRLLDGAAAADFLKEGGCRVVFVDRRHEARFARRAEALGLRIQRGTELRGLAYGDLREVRISAYRSGF